MSLPEMANSNVEYISGNTRGRLVFAYYDENGQLKLQQLLSDDNDRTLDEIFAALNIADIALANSTVNGTVSRRSPRSNALNGTVSRRSPRFNTLNNRVSPTRSPRSNALNGTVSRRSPRSNGTLGTVSNSFNGSPIRSPRSNGTVSPRSNGTVSRGSPTRRSPRINGTLNGVNGTVENALNGVNGTVENALNGVNGTVENALNGVNGTTNRTNRMNGSPTRSRSASPRNRLNGVNGVNGTVRSPVSSPRNSTTTSPLLNNIGTTNSTNRGSSLFTNGNTGLANGTVNGNPRTLSLIFENGTVSLQDTSDLQTV